MTIPLDRFGRTGHLSSRVLFGAAALARVDQATADRTLEVLVSYGVNHIDAAASYGDAEWTMSTCGSYTTLPIPSSGIPLSVRGRDRSGHRGPGAKAGPLDRRDRARVSDRRHPPSESRAV